MEETSGGSKPLAPRGRGWGIAVRSGWPPTFAKAVTLVETSPIARGASVDPPGTGVRAPLSERVRSLRLPQSGTPARAAGHWLPWTLCLLLLGTTAVFGYLAFQREPAAGVPAPSAARPGDGMAQPTAAAPADRGAVVLESKGYIVPAQQILVSPKVAGMIEKLYVREGQRVEKDAVLAQLESTDYRADLDRAKAQLELARWAYQELRAGSRPEEKDQARAELQEATAQRDQLKSERDRRHELWQKRVISDQEYEEAESKYQAMAERVKRLTASYQLVHIGPRDERIKVAEAQVRQAEAELSKAEWRLSNCTIRAPVSGTILKKNCEEGNIVNPIAFNGSFSICDMADLSKLEVELTIQERDISHVFQGQKCEIRAEAYPKRKYDGVVSRLMPIADRAKGAIPVRVAVSVPPGEEGQYLKPEMSATVTFLNESSP